MSSYLGFEPILEVLSGAVEREGVYSPSPPEPLFLNKNIYNWVPRANSGLTRDPARYNYDLKSLKKMLREAAKKSSFLCAPPPPRLSGHRNFFPHS